MKKIISTENINVQFYSFIKISRFYFYENVR